jgi:hypothetical protein
MMNSIELEVSKTQSIQIYLPCKKEYIKSFDNVSIRYLKEQLKFDLYFNDFASEAIKSLRNLLNKALNSELQIQSEYIDKGIGYYHNIYSHKLWTDDDLSIIDPAENFILWSTPSHIGIETYIYNIQDKIYIERNIKMIIYRSFMDRIMERRKD